MPVKNPPDTKPNPNPNLSLTITLTLHGGSFSGFFLPDTVFNNKECGNLKVVVESLLEILTKRRSQTFYRSIELSSVINAVGEGVSLICKCYIVNQLGKRDFPCG